MCRTGTQNHGSYIHTVCAEIHLKQRALHGVSPLPLRCGSFRRKPRPRLLYSQAHAGAGKEETFSKIPCNFPEHRPKCWNLNSANIRLEHRCVPSYRDFFLIDAAKVWPHCGHKHPSRTRLPCLILAEAAARALGLAPVPRKSPTGCGLCPTWGSAPPSRTGFHLPLLGTPVGSPRPFPSLPTCSSSPFWSIPRIRSGPV